MILPNIHDNVPIKLEIFYIIILIISVICILYILRINGEKYIGLINENISN